jgi:hypothetical protein
MTTQTQAPPVTSKVAAAAEEMQWKTLDAIAALAEMNQRVAGGLISMSSAAAVETIRAFTELQSAAVDSLRATREPKAEPMNGGEAGQREPLGWYRRGFDSVMEDTQRWVKLLETDAQIITRSMERRQASAERTGKEIREALSSCASRMREIYGRQQRDATS